MKVEQIIEDVRTPLLARIKELESENARLRQQRDAANAQLDWLIEQTGTKRVIRSNMDECD